MPPTAHRQQSTFVAGGGGEVSKSWSYDSAVGAGSLLVAVCAVLDPDAFNATAATFSDTRGNTWTTVINRGVNDTDLVSGRLALAYAVNATAGANTVTCDPPGSSYITLVLVGNLDPDRVTASAERYFGRIPRGRNAVPDVGSDCLVCKLGDEVSLPVMLHAFWNHPVEGAVESRERHNADLLRFHFGNVA